MTTPYRRNSALSDIKRKSTVLLRRALPYNSSTVVKASMRGFVRWKYDGTKKRRFGINFGELVERTDFGYDAHALGAKLRDSRMRAQICGFRARKGKRAERVEVARD
mmetsp:Transcript_3652/g.10168  ORF Transcript_3652/g.10168 Transcript_3652/m.10168 type:complete len:107 (+) Transcript_3652:1905-2225(+)